MRPTMTPRLSQITLLVGFGLALGLGPTIAFAGGPTIGTEFGVNTYSTNSQAWSSVAMQPDGGFVVVWESYGSNGTDSSAWSVRGQRFDANGDKEGPEFQLNTYTTGSQSSPDVGYASDGSFVVVWASPGSSGTDTDNSSIQGQRFDASGAPVGGEFQINSYTMNSQSAPRVDVAATGSFVVAWRNDGASPGNDTDAASIVARRFDANGNPLAPDFQVNTYTTNGQYHSDIKMADDGTFIIVWGSDGSAGTDTSNRSVHLQRYDSSGLPIDSEMQLNTYTTQSQSWPRLTLLPTGDFIVVWESSGGFGTDTSGSTSQARIFDSSATPLGPEFQVNTYTFASQDDPSVASDGNGEFVVTWWNSSGSNGDDSSSSSVQGQRFLVDGTPVGDEFQVNSYTIGKQLSGEVAMNTNGDFVIVWQSEGPLEGSYEYNIKGQRFGTRIFSDGFESGNTSAWSVVVP